MLDFPSEFGTWRVLQSVNRAAAEVNRVTEIPQSELMHSPGLLPLLTAQARK